MERGYSTSDNVRVFAGGTYNDYFLLYFQEPSERRPEVVSVSRYSVPGRCEVYDFDYAPSSQSGIGDRIRFFSDTGTTMPEALKMLNRDLNKKQVVEMVLDLCRQQAHRGFARNLSKNLLARIAPKSKTQIAVQELLEGRKIVV